MAEREIDDERIAAVCQVLHEHEVAFVIIGGVAARLHDTGHATVDVDICPSRAHLQPVRLPGPALVGAPGSAVRLAISRAVLWDAAGRVHDPRHPEAARPREA